MIKHRSGIWKLLLGLMLIGLLGTSCDRRSKYQKWLDQELASGVRHDSLFYGLYLGMNAKDFFEHCYQMNQENKFFQGDANVKYYMKDELPFPATMEFYPEFQDRKIIEMPVSFTYDSWSPWNKRTFSDSLQLDVKKLFEKWYGPGFIEVESPRKGEGVAFVKIDGNRRTVIVKLDDKMVRALITDMSVKRKEDQELTRQNQDSIPSSVQ